MSSDAAHWRYMRTNVIVLIVGICVLALFVYILNYLDDRRTVRITKTYMLETCSVRDISNFLKSELADDDMGAELVKKVSLEPDLSLAVSALVDICVENVNRPKTNLEILRILRRNYQHISRPETIAKFLDSEDIRVKAGAISVLLHFDRYEEPVVRAFRSCSDGVWGPIFVAQEVGSAGKRAHKIVDSFYQWLALPDSSVKCVVIDQIVKIDVNRDRIRQRLIEMVADQTLEERVREHARRHLESEK